LADPACSPFLNRLSRQPDRRFLLSFYRKIIGFRPPAISIYQAPTRRETVTYVSNIFLYYIA